MRPLKVSFFAKGLRRAARFIPGALSVPPLRQAKLMDVDLKQSEPVPPFSASSPRPFTRMSLPTPLNIVSLQLKALNGLS
jgi:hypothetical protein